MPQVVAAQNTGSGSPGPALDVLLDPSFRGSFDRLTRLSAALLSVPRARVHLCASGRVRLHGTFPPGESEDVAGDPWRVLAGRVSGTGQPLAIADLRKWGEAQHAGAGAYLGIPLWSREAEAVGVLAVMCPRARQWRADEIMELGDLATGAMAEVELLLRETASARPVRVALGGARELRTFLDTAHRLLAAAPAGSSLEQAMAMLRQLTSAVGEYQSHEEEIRRLTDELRRVREDAALEQHLARGLLDALPYPCLVTDAAGAIQSANLAAGALLGQSLEALTRSTLESFVVDSSLADFRARLSRATSERWSEDCPLELAARSGTRRRSCIVVAVGPCGEAGMRLYWLVREPADPGESAGPQSAPPQVRNGIEDPLDLFQLAAGHGTAAPDPGLRPDAGRDAAGSADAELPGRLRDLITGALHVGSLKVGDRLPSIRKTSRVFGVTPYASLQAYATLEAEGLVERRERSGIYVAALERRGAPDLPEAGRWLAGVLSEACEQQLKIPLLPDLIRRWTSAVPVRCVCVDTCEDDRVALCLELSQQFGVSTCPVAPNVAIEAACQGGDLGRLPDEIRNADLLITTAYHAGQLRELARATGKPLLAATLSPLLVAATLGRLRERELVVICVDPAYGERVRGLHGGAYGDRVRVVLTHDAAALRALDRSEPVLLTPAARQRLKRADFRLIAPLHPFFSLEFARKMSEALVRVNLGTARG